jgi:nicotinamidase-related amidase
MVETGGSAVLVVDAQRGLFESDRPCYRAAAVMERIAAAVTRGRRAGLPVVFVQDDRGPALWEPHDELWQISPPLELRPEDARFDKTHRDAFHHTPLLERLLAGRVSHLLVGGCMTQFSIVSTVGGAVAEGFGVTLLADAHSTWDTPAGTAAEHIARHNAVLHGFNVADGLCLVAPVDEVDFAAPVDPCVLHGLR